MIDANPVDHTSHPRHTVSIEEVEDEGDPGWQNTVSDGIIVEEDDSAGESLGKGEARCQTQYKTQQGLGQDPWAPFETMREWKFAEWIMKSGISQGQMTSLIQLEQVSSIYDPIQDGNTDSLH